MNNIRSICAASLLLGTVAVVFTAGLPKASVTVRVTDSATLAPIADAKARITFTVPDGQGGTKPLQRANTTDANGEFSASENTLFNISADARKAGYYRTTASLDLRPTLSDSYGQPAIIAIILKRIEHPTAMYARTHARLEVPNGAQQFGFDLVQCDWIAPLGKGLMSDFVFTVSDAAVGGNDSTKVVTLTFSNDGDGIQSIEADPNEGSELRLPTIAPESGYASSWTQRASKSYVPNKKANYFFRVRTAKDGPRIRSALYGKIHGDIAIDTINSKTALIFLNYYLNPDGTRNVEFDPNKNLFKDLPVMEQVRDP
jgi:hypothetical protein